MKKAEDAKAPTRVRVRGGVRVKVSVKKRLMPKFRPGALDATNHAFN